MRALPLAGLALLLVVGANAGSVTLNSTGQGWINSTGNDGSTVTNNYVAGNCCGNGEYRNFFEFSLPALSGTVVSAALILNSATVAQGQAPTSITYQVTSLSGTPTFTTLGAGTVYGGFVYTTADTGVTENISLDAAALAAIQADSGGAFELSGSVIAGATFGDGLPDQNVFGSSQEDAGQLQIVTSTSTVPEPSSALLVCSGALALVCLRRRRRI